MCSTMKAEIADLRQPQRSRVVSAQLSHGAFAQLNYLTLEQRDHRLLLVYVCL